MDMIALLGEAGFDLVHPFDAHACARELGVELLADPARPAGLLVGNTRAFWARLTAARAADPELAASSDPIELHVERTFARLDGARCYFAHRAYGGAFLPFQRLAVAAGLGTLSPAQLVIHPTFGPWFALRAVVLTAGEPTTRTLPAPACSCEPACVAAFERARQTRGPDAWRAWVAVRDACCVGREHRYSDEQIEYHYTRARFV